MLGVTLRPLNKVCKTTSGGVARVWIFDPEDYSFTQAPDDPVTGPQPYSAIALRSGGTGATGTVTAAAGVVTAISVTAGGTGYIVPPLVVISGAGTGATAVANIVGGVVVSVTITAGGTGYTGTPTVAFTAVGATVLGGARLFPINFSKKGNEAEYTYKQSRKGSANKVEHQLQFFLNELDQLTTQWNKAVDDAGACSGIGMIIQLNSGKVFVAGERYVGNNPINVPLLMVQDGSSGTSGKLFDDQNGQETVLKGDNGQTLYEYTGGLASLVALQ
jgi:hypothetical protein